MYGLRNELPTHQNNSRGLIAINLSFNVLKDISAEDISTALMTDSYLRSLDISFNQFSEISCKKFIYAMRKNFTLINLDLRNNPGYSENIHRRILTKLMRNIRDLKKKSIIKMN